VEQNRRPRYESTQLCPPVDKDAQNDVEMTASSTNVLEKLDICMEKSETRSMSFTLYKH
jgi:hypothetical protein